MPDAGRVIAGRARGRRLAAPGEGTRPLADRVKETLFAILEPQIPGAAVLDLFAGSGAAGIELDFAATSEGWGAAKPAPEFFANVVREAGLPAAEIAYVGDRLDNDVLPANAAGMVSVFVRRGPWGFVHATRPEAAEARIRVDSLAELPAALRDG